MSVLEGGYGELKVRRNAILWTVLHCKREEQMRDLICPWFGAAFLVDSSEYVATRAGTERQVGVRP